MLAKQLCCFQKTKTKGELVVGDISTWVQHVFKSIIS